MASTHDRRVRDLVAPAKLRSIARRRDGPGFVHLVAHLLALLVAGALVHLALGTAWIMPALILHGIVVVHLFAPFHECAHYTAFKTRWMNRWLQRVTGFLLFLPPTHFRHEHAAHHAHTQDPDHDPELITHTASVGGYLLYASALPYFRNALVNLVNHARGRFSAAERAFLPDKALPLAVREARLMWAGYALILVASLALQSWAAVLYWLGPRLLGEPFMRIIRMSEHGACPLVPDALRNTRTVLTLAPVRWLAWNMSLHAEHHALPAVPFHALPAVHADLKAHLDEVRSGYVVTQAHILRKARQAA